jgi:hypothetical protein
MKTVTPKHTEAPATVPAFRILKIATCPSLSGKSKLTYHLGCNTEGEILLRVYANSQAGFFNNEWVALTAVQRQFAKGKEGKLTSSVLRPLFQGKSINTPPFLFAALLNEELVRPSTTTKRCYESTDGKKFFAQAKALIASKVDLTDKVPKALKVEAKAATVKPGNKPGKEGEAAAKADGTGKTRRAASNAKPGSVASGKKPARKVTAATA